MQGVKALKTRCITYHSSRPGRMVSFLSVPPVTGRLNSRLCMNENPMEKKKPKIGVCSICGQEDELTREHIPPKGIFLSPRPVNTITVFRAKSATMILSLMMNIFVFGSQQALTQIQNWTLSGRTRWLDRALKGVQHF